MIKIEVQSTRAVIRFQEPLTVGLRGAKVSFAFGQDWESLSKTAVFRQADRTVSVAAEPETVIPWEVLTMPGVPVQIGVYGVDSTGAVAIPTVWAVTQPVRPGTDPAGDPALEPTPGLWEQMQGKLTELETALENTQAPVYTVTVRKNEDGSYWADKSPEDRADAYLAGKMLMCHWTEYNLLLPLSHTSGRRTFVFRTVKDGSEYCVEMTEDIQCTRKALETEAPVQSVNGQTGDVVLPTPLKVTVSQGTEGDYFADTDPDVIQEALDHNRTLVCCWQEKNVMLPLTSFRQGGPYSFTAVTGKQEYSVTIYDTENIACTVKKLSPEAVLYTPQELTPEQQTQALKNLGLDELPTGGDWKWEKITELTTEEKVLSVTLPVDGSQYKCLFLRGSIRAWDVKNDAIYTGSSMLTGGMISGIFNVAYGYLGQYTTFEALFIGTGDSFVPFVFNPNGNLSANGTITTYNPQKGKFNITNAIAVAAWSSNAYMFTEGCIFELWGVRK